MRYHVFILFSILLFSCKKDILAGKKTYSLDGEKYVSDYKIVNGDTILHGEVRVYDKNGKLKCLMHFLNGKAHGDYKAYYESGAIQIKCRYFKDAINGDMLYFHENATLSRYTLQDSFGRSCFLLEFDKNRKMIQKIGRSVNCFLDKDSVAKGKPLLMDIFLANIPNTKRSLQLVYHNNINTTRTLKTLSENYIHLEEINKNKGKNLLYVISKYKFDSSYKNVEVVDTAFIDFYVY